MLRLSSSFQRILAQLLYQQNFNEGGVLSVMITNKEDQEDTNEKGERREWGELKLLTWLAL